MWVTQVGTLEKNMVIVAPGSKKTLGRKHVFDATGS